MLPTPLPSGEDLPPTALFASLPTAGESLFQTFFGHLLSSPAQAPATSVEAQSALREEFPAEVGALAADLRRIQADINQRNVGQQSGRHLASRPPEIRKKRERKSWGVRYKCTVRGGPQSHLQPANPISGRFLNIH